MSYVNVAMGALKMGGALIQGRSDRMNANTEAMSMNYEADQEEQAAMQQADIIRRARDYTVARADTSYAASGVQVGVGSAAETDRNIIDRGTHDAYQTILAGEKRAHQLRAGAVITAAGGKLQAVNGLLQGSGSALQSGYQGYSGWKSQQAAQPSGG